MLGGKALVTNIAKHEIPKYQIKFVIFLSVSRINEKDKVNL